MIYLYNFVIFFSVFVIVSFHSYIFGNVNKHFLTWNPYISMCIYIYISHCYNIVSSTEEFAHKVKPFLLYNFSMVFHIYIYI